MTSSQKSAHPAPAAANPGITLTDVTKRFGDNEVLRGVTATLPAGKIYGLLGRNGVGKTTLMSLICAHQFRTSGTILIDGEDPVENAPILARTCFIHEDQSYSELLTVKQALSLLPIFYPDYSPETAERLTQAFRLPLKTKANKLSRGQRSALGITLSLASRAPYTFLDEPHLGLDAAARTVFYEELVREYAEHPRTIILSTHLIDEAADLMEQVLILEDGRVVVQADVDQARGESFVVRGREADVRQLVGTREILTERRMGSLISAVVAGEPTSVDRSFAERSNLTLEEASLQEYVAALGQHWLAGPGGQVAGEGERR